jgi:hypothetical protein
MKQVAVIESDACIYMSSLMKTVSATETLTGKADASISRYRYAHTQTAE